MKQIGQLQSKMVTDFTHRPPKFTLSVTSSKKVGLFLFCTHYFKSDTVIYSLFQVRYSYTFRPDG